MKKESATNLSTKSSEKKLKRKLLKSSTKKSSHISFHVTKKKAKIPKEKLKGSMIEIKRKFFEPGGVKSTTFNLLISTLGTGILAMPTAYRSSGMILGTILMVISAGVSWLSMFCLVKFKLFFENF